MFLHKVLREIRKNAILLTMTKTSTLLGAADAALAIGVDRSTLVRWVKSGKITPAHKNTGSRGAYVFRVRDVERLREQRAR